MHLDASKNVLLNLVVKSVHLLYQLKFDVIFFIAMMSTCKVTIKDIQKRMLVKTKSATLGG